MAEEHISQEFRLKNIKETKNYFIKEKDQNELMTKRQREVCTTLDFIERFFILAFVVTGCISISAFISSLDIPIGITSFSIGLKTCSVTAVIKKCKSIIKRK